VGRLDGQQLSIPLGMASDPGDPCTLVSGSYVLATATPSGEQPPRATSIAGKVTVRYTGQCVTLGGSGAFYANDVLELAAGFSGKRN